jgi:uncharacterized protein (TIGR00251 family)
MAEAGKSARLRVLATPRSSRDRVMGCQAGELKVSLAAPPVGGAANAALSRLLARALGLPAKKVQVVAGQASRHKTVKIDGLTLEEVQERLGVPPDPSPGA